MKKPSLDSLRLLAIDPSTKGFGFIVLEGEENAIDWGVRSAKGDKNAECLRQIAKLIARYRPDVIVVEDYRDKAARRPSRLLELVQRIRTLAIANRIKSRGVSRSQVRRVFVQFGALTKHQIAVEIAKRFPELIPHLPRPRKPWMSEDERVSIFDAAALALTLLYPRISSPSMRKRA